MGSNNTNDMGSNDTDDSDYEDEGTDDNDDDDIESIKSESIKSENMSSDDNSDDNDDDDDKSISDDSPPDPQLKTRSDDESISDDTSSVESIDEIRSAIDATNVIEGKRVRTETVQPNISSFGGKYHVNMFNIGRDEFTQFEQVKERLYSTAVRLCFNQMTASKGIKLYGPKAVAAMFKE